VFAEIAVRSAGPDGPVVGEGDRVAAELVPVPVGGAERARLARRAHAVTGLPLVSGLFAQGSVGAAVVDAAAAGLPRLPTEAWPTLDVMVSERAHEITPERVRSVVEQLRVMSLPEAVDTRAARAAADRGVWLRRAGVGADQDGWDLRGTLHGLPGDQIVALIHAYARPEDADDPRTPAQRRHDGLAQICRLTARASGTPIPASPGNRASAEDAASVEAQREVTGDQPRSGDVVRRPAHGMDAHVLVIATAQAWRGDPGAPAAITSTGSVLDPGQLAALRCDARPDVLITAHPTDPGPNDPAPTEVGPSQAGPSDAELVRRVLRGLVPGIGAATVMPLAFGRTERFASTAQWLGLVARDGGCVTPGWSLSNFLCKWG
jgi:hypothetical protein